MKNQLLGGIVGGVILFFWGALVWAVLPLHTDWMKTPVNEDAVLAAMKGSMGEKGVYYLPAMPARENRTPAEYEALQKEQQRKMEAGPAAMVVYAPAGMPSASAGRMILGLVISFLSAFLASWLLARSTAFNAGYLARVAFCGVLGVFVSVVIHLVNFNWMGYPGDYTVAMIVDTVGGWIVAGLGIAAIVKYKEPVPGPPIAAH